MKTLLSLVVCFALASITQAQFNSDNSIKLPDGGFSTAVSSDGSTIINGGPHAFLNVGAAVVYRVANGQCPYIEAILNPKDNIKSSWFGQIVALSADGNTAVIGGDSDDVGTGAV